METMVETLSDKGIGLPRSVALVGNAPGRWQGAGAIDGADWVVRFNNAPGFGGRMGNRVTHLVLVNHGGQMREWLDDPSFLRRPVVAGAAAVWLPFGEKASSETGDGADWTAEARGRFAGLGVPVTLLPQSARDEAAALLAANGAGGAAPSTGFLTALFVLGLLKGREIPVHAYGFGFAGWEGHAWHVERAWFTAMAREGRLRFAGAEPS